MEHFEIFGDRYSAQVCAEKSFLNEKIYWVGSCKCPMNAWAHCSCPITATTENGSKIKITGHGYRNHAEIFLYID